MKMNDPDAGSEGEGRQTFICIKNFHIFYFTKELMTNSFYGMTFVGKLKT